ncbi:MAG: serine/threonine protein kinase [Lachnospiraceae bacterium]|nr:serine/threonine protein kinase [Lachnospiraceae bacterium]
MSDEEYEYCPRCEANLTLQKGYRNDLPYWVCRGCGETLINPEVATDSNIVWCCDGCGAMLNIQPGFNEDSGEWKCSECGFVNKIDASELYLSEEEYLADLRDPYRGISDGDILELSMYREEGNIGDREDIILVRHGESGERFVKKILGTYDRSVYDYLQEHPVRNMPRIILLYEGENSLIVIEEYIEGKTLEELLQEGTFSEDFALSVTKKICSVLDELHHALNGIVHRDIKPSNVMVGPDDSVYLLDLNIAKWYDESKSDDTEHMGTRNFAAPEQAGFGMKASSEKTDVYALGMLMNVMLTGKFPKEEKAEGKLWPVIERCISLDPKDRFSTKELMDILDEME